MELNKAFTLSGNRPVDVFAIKTGRWGRELIKTKGVLEGELELSVGEAASMLYRDKETLALPIRREDGKIFYLLIEQIADA